MILSKIHINIYAILIFGALFVLSCSTMKVSYNYDQNVNFTKYHNYSWAVEEKSKQEASLTTIARRNIIKKEVTRIIRNELGSRGFEESIKNPDFLVAYHTGIKGRVDVREFGYNYTTESRTWGWGPDPLQITPYQEGSLIVDIIDADSKNLVWRGIAQEIIPDNPLPEEIVKLLEEAVPKILKNFPPGQK